MRFHVSVDAWMKALIATLALSPVAACGSTTTGGDGGGGSAPTAKCKDATPVQVAGKDTGYEACTGQWKHRPSITACPSELPRSTTCNLGTGGGVNVTCTQDSDCADKPNGYCQANSGFEGPGCNCNYGCVTDADCSAGFICLCGSPVGYCVKADCKSDADCGSAFCATYTANPGCGGTVFACQNAADECTGDGDCPQGQQCTMGATHRVCESPSCAIGRPFLVAGEERLAPVARRADWHAPGLAPRIDALGDAEREALALHWTKVAQMEHASVAAFARFVLQLLAQGAPADLVREAQAAMADETRHAEIGFALASAYAGAPIGPGPLAIDRALESCDLAASVITTIHEGCVGETVAAIEAAEVAARAVDPAIREVLAGIAADESRHAELAWRYVRWAIQANPALAEVARAEFERALASAPLAEAETEEPLIAHGAPSEGLRRAIRRRALEGVVGPCARALLASVERPRAEALSLEA